MQIDDQDEKLRELHGELGNDVYMAVTKALLELREYNASGGYAVPELWSYKDNRRVSLREVIEYLINQLKAVKRKRKRSQLF